jgi:hypothetical protein
MLGLAALFLLALVLVLLEFVFAREAIAESFGDGTRDIYVAVVAAFTGMLVSAFSERILALLRRVVAIGWQYVFLIVVCLVQFGLCGAIAFAIGWLVLGTLLWVVGSAFGFVQGAFSLSSVGYAALAGVVVGAVGGLFIGFKEVRESGGDVSVAIENISASSGPSHPTFHGGETFGHLFVHVVLAGGLVALFEMGQAVIFWFLLLGGYFAGAALCSVGVATAKVASALIRNRT